MLQSDFEKKNVNIRVKTTITNGAETETFELATLGILHNKSNADYLQYDEKDENGKINTIVKFTDTECMLMRSGSVKMKQTFHENEVTFGYYESMYGRLEMQTDTKKIVREWNSLEKEGKIDLLYDLSMQGNHLGHYQMIIMYREEA